MLDSLRHDVANAVKFGFDRKYFLSMQKLECIKSKSQSTPIHFDFIGICIVIKINGSVIDAV